MSARLAQGTARRREAALRPPGLDGAALREVGSIARRVVVAEGPGIVRDPRAGHPYRLVDALLHQERVDRQELLGLRAQGQRGQIAPLGNQGVVVEVLRLWWTEHGEPRDRLEHLLRVEVAL